jgi:hypothetical protein
MAVEGTSHTWRDRPAPVGGRRPALARAMSLVLWLLAVSLLAQVIFAGLFLDGHDAWRDWHAANGMVLLVCGRAAAPAGRPSPAWGCW